MNILHLKAGDPVVAHKVNTFGRYEFLELSIKKVTGPVAVIDHCMSFQRDTGKLTGGLRPTTDLRAWEAFPADYKTIVKQLKEQAEGTLDPAYTPDRVRLMKSIARISSFCDVDMYDLEELGVAKGIIGWFSVEEDYKDP